jgi:hypothetical protein
VKAIKAIYNILSNNSGVTALVSTRINPLRIPEKSGLPAIAYQLVNNTGHMSKSGYSHTDFARVQVMCVADNYAGAIALSEAVREAMEISTPATFNGVKVQVLEYDGEVHMADDNAGFAGVSTVAMDFIINFTR